MIGFLPMDSSTVARLQMLIAALLFSTGGAAIKLCALSSWQVAGSRSAVAAVVLLLALRVAPRQWSWRTPLVGLAYAGTMLSFVAANKLTTAANTIFLQSTAPLYILMLGPWLLREPLRRRDLSFMAVLGVGLGLFFVGRDPTFASAPDPASGNLIGAVSGVFWALTIVSLRWIGTVEPAGIGAALVTGNLIAFIACLPWSLPVANGGVTDWLIAGYLGMFQVGLAYVFMSAGMRHVPALEASLLLLLEPVLSPLWAAAIHGERPGLWSLLGGVIILLATLVKTLIDARGVSPMRNHG